MKDSRSGPLVVGGIIAGLVLPPLMFWPATRGPSIEPREAERLMSADSAAWILVDVRSSEAFQTVHISGAINIPASTFTVQQGGAWREELAGKTHIMVVCTIGAASARVVNGLHQAGFSQAVSVAGGMDRWLQSAEGGVCLANSGRAEELREVRLVPQQAFSLLEQMMICVASFGIKPLYELFALVVASVLWRFKDPDWAALRRSMIAFFLGENACSVNFFFFGGESRLWEFFHSFGMVVAFGFFAYACMAALDDRVIRFSSPEARCALLGSCGSCYKHREVRCPLRRIFLFLVLASASVACMLLSARPSLRSVRGDVFGTDVLFGHSVVAQLYEVRLLPLVAIPLLLAAWLVLWRERERGFALSKILLAMGLGPLSFGLVRFMIDWGFAANPLWANVWEELTELLFVALAVWLLLGAEQVRSGWPLRLWRVRSEHSQARG